MKFFLLNFLNLMSCEKRNRVILVNIFFKIFSQFFKIRVECPFNTYFKLGPSNYLPFVEAKPGKRLHTEPYVGTNSLIR